jgi:hypothetical protein
MFLNKVMTVITGEFFLKIMPNGGTAVLLRAAFISIYLYLLVIAVKSFTSECAIFSFAADQLRSEFNSTIPWFGAIFGGTYAALYSRFSSQWSYLADLYNQQLSASLTLSKEQINDDNYAIWQAAFIEDAVCMHLATKPGFSNAILGMLQEKQIREILEEDEHFGKERVSELVQSLTQAVKKKL